MTKGQELTTPESGGYLANIGGVDLRSIIADNIGVGSMSPRSLPRIRIPSGGGKSWEIPTLDGFDSAQEFAGTIVHWQTMRAYWPESFQDSDGAPPQCTSNDGILGVGDPGGACGRCPNNQFGSARDSRGKACREIAALLVMMEGITLPFFAPMPPMSIGPVRDYFTRLVQYGLHYWQVETSFKLAQTKSRGGVTYPKAEVSLSRKLREDEVTRIADYREALVPAMSGMATSPEDFE